MNSGLYETGDVLDSRELARLERLALERSSSALTRALPSYTGPAAGGLTALSGRARAAVAHAPLPARAAPRDTGAARPRVTRTDAGHWAFTVAAAALCIAVLWVVQDTIWSGAPRIHGAAGRVWGDLDWLWLAQLPASVINLTGLLMYRPSRKDRHAAPIPHFVCWRIVSRGTNTEALAATIRRVQGEMRATPLFRYVIEVVTDIPNPLLPQGLDIAYLVVPERYQTSNGSKFKARALQYALEYSPLADTSWIVHLDEESRPVPSGIRGIARMIAEEEASGQLRIGQGAILYHRSWKEHPFLTLADMPRTGDDLGRFYLAYRTGVTLFGMHGSFIVARNDVVKAAGFDFGPVGSVTEDAFWALCEMEAGQRVRWVDGYLEEQSTQGIMDFLKQRRRWFQGIVKVCLFAPVHWKWRVTFSLSTLLWATAPVGMAYTLAHLVAGGSAPLAMRALGDFALAGCVAVVLTGLRVNMDEHGIFDRGRRLMWYAVILPAISVAWLLEAVGVGYAIVSPGSGFHVVKK